MTLDPGKLTALRNLARKKAGEQVDWIKISDARALTEVGFAERNREGWTITAAGEALLAASGDLAEETPSRDRASVVATIRPVLVDAAAATNAPENPLD